MSALYQVVGRKIENDEAGVKKLLLFVFRLKGDGLTQGFCVCEKIHK